MLKGVRISLATPLARRAVLATDIDVWLEDLPLIWMMYSNMIYNNKFTYLFPQKRGYIYIYIYINGVKVTHLRTCLVDCNRYCNIIVILMV